MYSRRDLIVLFAVVAVLSAWGRNWLSAEAAEATEATRQVALEAAMAYPILLADTKQTTVVKVGLAGFKLDSNQQRAPVNVALVLDKSGSMSGAKIEKAKQAAIDAVRRLGPQDIVSVVTYDSTVSVLVPATRLTDKEPVLAAIRQIGAGGSTALFGGVSKGAEEVRKFLDRERVNRVLLLSDGLANVGPQSPAELGELGASLIKENIAVSTMGLGLDYNEDLMAQLADKSDGNHVFAESSSDLAAFFDAEFDDVLSVVAQEIAIHIKCAEGIRPVRVVNYDAEISGQDVIVKFNQIYSEQEKYLVLEVEVPASPSDAARPVATVSASYTNMVTMATDELSGSVDVRFSAEEAEVAAATNRIVAYNCVAQIANDRNAEAIRLRDQGDVEGARELLRKISTYLRDEAQKLDQKPLADQAERNEWLSDNLDKGDYGRVRKAVIMDQQNRRGNVPSRSDGR